MADDPPAIEWQEHIGNWTGLYNRWVVASVNRYQGEPGEWFWRVSLAGPGTTLAARFETADEAKEAVADYLGDKLAAWPGQG